MTPKSIQPPQFDPNTYARITMNDLVVYTLRYLQKQGSESASEDIIAACFTLFPKRFSLQKYPHWPDAAVVNRRRGDCKRKGWLRGSASQGFKLTAKGLKRAEKVAKMLGKPLKSAPLTSKTGTKTPQVPVPPIHPELKLRARKYIRSIESSDAYKHYQKRKPVNEFDFRSLLLCTMESPATTLARNLVQFKEYVTICDRQDLLAFLEYSESKFPHLLGVATKLVEKKSTRAQK